MGKSEKKKKHKQRYRSSSSSSDSSRSRNRKSSSTHRRAKKRRKVSSKRDEISSTENRKHEDQSLDRSRSKGTTYCLSSSPLRAKKRKHDKDHKHSRSKTGEKKLKKSKYFSSSSSSETSSSDSDSPPRKPRKKVKKKKKRKRLSSVDNEDATTRDLANKAKGVKQQSKSCESSQVATNQVMKKTSPEVDQRSLAMRPMTQAEWEARQSVVRRVYDEATGRSRLVKGDGEILEEIVSRERHLEINRKATRGDGNTFQATLGLTNQR